ncbi:MAG TPA: hypothetical protein VK540_19280 [Polyangiaceae bacterium]|jgi:hypothetical protein|nr:hypothetical protein [Polyangiaceae bacterium]
MKSFVGADTDRAAVTRIQHGAVSRPPTARARPSAIKVVPSAAGTTVHALKNALQELVGVELLTSALATLPSDVVEAFEPVTPMNWVPVEVIYTVVARVAEHANRPYDELMDEAVQRAGEKTLRTAWRMLLRVTADNALLTRAPILYSKWRNIGRLETKIVARGKVELFLTEWPGMSERSIRSLAVTIATVLRLAGRKGVKIQSQSTPDGAKYAVAWEISGKPG